MVQKYNYSDHQPPFNQKLPYGSNKKSENSKAQDYGLDYLLHAEKVMGEDKESSEEESSSSSEESTKTKDVEDKDAKTEESEEYEDGDTSEDKEEVKEKVEDIYKLQAEKDRANREEMKQVLENAKGTALKKMKKETDKSASAERVEKEHDNKFQRILKKLLANDQDNERRRRKRRAASVEEKINNVPNDQDLKPVAARGN